MPLPCSIMPTCRCRPRSTGCCASCVVTPDMHRVHHSILRNETDSNFGFNLPWWDRLFGTYRAAPAAGHQGMTIGLPIFRNRRELRVDRLLTQPFRDDVADSGHGGGMMRPGR